MPKNKLILASGSSIRAEMLSKAGVIPQIIPARIDEAALKTGMIAESAPLRDIVDLLADMKAKKVAQAHPEALVLGADQILVYNGRIFDKPTDPSDARSQLLELRGQSHNLLSAAVIYEKGRPVWRHIGKARLIMRNFSDDFLDDYIAAHGDDLCATVGCYKIEQDGTTLFSRIEGDYFSILGLPLLEVLAFLRSRGIIRA